MASGMDAFYRGIVAYDVMPITTSLALGYGALAFPFFGVIAAGGLVVADVFSWRRAQWCLVLAAALLAVGIFRALIFSYFGPAQRTARPTAATLLRSSPTSYSNFIAHAQKS